MFTGVCLSTGRGSAPGVPARGGACSGGWVVPGLGGSAPQGCLVPGGSAPGGCLLWGVPDPGGSAPGRVPGRDPPPTTATAVGSTHPTGMHSCFAYIL